MELQTIKYISMIVLLTSNLIMTLIGICLQKLLRRRDGKVLSTTQLVISCLTSGILLGTLLMIILPNSLELVAHQWHTTNMGYLLIGLGFFLICIIQELINSYEMSLSKRKIGTEEEKIIVISVESCHDNNLTRLITIVFALGVHYFFNGILIGGQKRDAMELWILLIVTCFHMSLIAFSLTIRLLMDNDNYLRVFCAMFLWSIMGSLGVLTSLLISSDSSGLDFINGILQCLSTGTFLYITFIDMIHSDLMKRKLYPFVNIILIFGGFLIIVLISLLHKHAH